MNNPIFTEEMLDDLNMSLFEISESDNTDPKSFYTSVANVLLSAGISIKDPSLVNFEEEDFDTWFPVASVKKGAGAVPINLYVAYSVAKADAGFVSHAELVDDDDLAEILRFANLSNDDNDGVEDTDAES